MKTIALFFSALMLLAVFTATAFLQAPGAYTVPTASSVTGTRTSYIEGNVTSDQNWNGTVYIGGNVTIRSGVTVTVEPGTNVIFNSSQVKTKAGVNYPYAWPDIFVYGAFVAQGNNTNPITFKSDSINPTDRTKSFFFDYIWFYTGATPPAFKYCSFQSGAGCIWSNESLTVEHCTFNEFNRALRITNYADLTMTNSTFNTNDTTEFDSYYNSGGSFAVQADSGGDFVFQDVTYKGKGIWMNLKKVGDVEITRCNVDSTYSGYYTEEAMIMSECGSMNITKTTLLCGENYGIYQQDCRGVINIWNMTVSNSVGTGLYLETLEPVSVRDVTWVECVDLIYVGDSEDVEVYDIHWDGPCDTAIDLYDVGDVTVHDITGEFNDYMVYTSTAEDVAIDRVYCTNQDGGTAFYISGASTIWVHNCSVNSDGRAIYTYSYETADWISLADLDIDIAGSSSTAISLDGAKVAKMERCDLNIEASKFLYLYEIGEFVHVGDNWKIDCDAWFDISYCGKVHFSGIDAEVSNYFASVSSSEDVVFTDMNLTETGSSYYAIIRVSGGGGFTLSNANIEMETGGGIDISSYYALNYVNISDVSITTQSEDEEDYGMTVESSISAVVENVDIVANKASGINITSEGTSVIEDVYIESKSQDTPIIAVFGEGDTTLTNIEVQAQYSPIFMYVENEGSLYASELYFEGGETATGIVDMGVGENTYSSIYMWGNYTEGLKFGSGGKTVENVEMSLVTDGLGIYCENIDMDVDMEKTIDITNVTIYGGFEGISINSSNSAIPFTTTITDSYIYQSVFPIYFKKGTANMNGVVIEDPPINSGTAIEIDAADVKLSNTILNYYETGITLDTVDSKLTCDFVDIAYSNIGIDNSVGGTLTIKNTNLQNTQLHGIDSASATTMTNVWFSRPANRCFSGESGDEFFFDFSSQVTPDYTTAAPIDIPGMEQLPYMRLRYDNSQQEEALEWDYLGKVVNFTIWSGDPDPDDTITYAACMLYDSAATEIKWEEIDLTGVNNYIEFTKSFDTSQFKDNTDVFFEAIVEFADGGVQDYYWSFTTLQPAIHNSTDGGVATDANDDKANARHLETNMKFDGCAINKPTDIDWYFIDAKNLKEFTVEVTESDRVMVEVYDPAGAKIGTYTNLNRTAQVLSPKDGMYNIKVFGNTSSYYSIEVLTVEKQKEKTMMDRVMEQGWFMMVMEASVGLLITATLAIVGIILLSRKRRKVSRYMNLITKAYEDNRATPPKALEELTKLHKEIEDMYKNGKFEENQYLILDKKVSDYITQLRIPETQQRVQQIEKEKLPAPLDQQMKEVVADGVVTPQEAADVKAATEKTDLPPEKKEEVEGMVEDWKEADMNLPPPPPPPE